MNDIYCAYSTLTERWQQRAFLLAIVERLFPAYNTFSSSLVFGDPSQLHVTAGQMWSAVLSDTFPFRPAITSSRLRRLTPLHRKFDNDLVEFAIASVNTLRQCIEFFSSNDAAIGRAIVLSMFEAIHSKIASKLEARLVLGPEDHGSNPLFVREQRTQLDLAAMLAGEPLSEAKVLMIRRQAREDSMWTQ